MEGDPGRISTFAENEDRATAPSGRSLLLSLSRRHRQGADYRVRSGTVGRVLEVARPHRRALLLFLIVVVFDSLGSALNPLLLRGLINNGVVKHRASLVIVLAACMGALTLVISGLTLVQAYVAARVSENVVFEDIRARMYRHLQSMPIAFFSRTQTGALVNRLNTDVAGAQSAFTDLLSNVVGNAVTVTFALAVMATLSWQISAAAIVALPIFGLVARRIGRRLATLTKARYDQTASMVTIMTERLNVGGALLVVRLFGRPEQESRLFEERAGRVRNTGIQIALYSRFYAIALGLGMTLATVVIYGWGGALAAHGTLQIGTLVALCTAYVGGIYGPLGSLSNAGVDVITTLVSFERVFELLELKPAVAERPHPKEFSERGATAAVTFDHVGFSYPAASEVSLASLELVDEVDDRQSPQVLADISFSAQPGSLVALVGRSGAGKTTIGSLIPRLYDVSSGSVRLNELDVRDVSLESLHAKVGVVSQEAHLFHDTLASNLLYANPDASREAVAAAIELAQLSDFVAQLPDGLETVVGELAVNASPAARNSASPSHGSSWAYSARRRRAR